MNDIIVYSKPDCPWCDKAKALLRQKALGQFKEKVLNVDFTRDDLRLIIGPEKPLTVPQIMINNHLIGTYQDLVNYIEEWEHTWYQH